MPVEEDIFYDVNGFEVSRTNLVQQMIDYYNEKLRIGETRVTDFSEGSEVRNLLEAVAVDIYNLMEDQNELSKIAFVETAEGEWLDKHGANPFVNLPRETGEVATGFVTFSIPSILSADVVIGEGTVLVSTENSLQYITDSDLVIPVGETSITGSASCLTVGADGNCGVDTVTLFEDDTFGVNGLTVTNSEAFTGGLDYEEDDDYRERLLGFLRKDDFGSVSYYENLCIEVPGVHDVLLVDATGYTKKVIVNGDSKPVSDDIILDVLDLLSIPDNIVLGHNFTVDKAVLDVHDLTVNLEVFNELDEDDLKEFIQAIFDGGSALVGFTFEGLSIGEGLSRNELYESLGMIDDINSILVCEDGVEITDLTVDPEEVLAVGELTINQTIIN